MLRKLENCASEVFLQDLKKKQAAVPLDSKTASQPSDAGFLDSQVIMKKNLQRSYFVILEAQTNYEKKFQKTIFWR